MSKEDLKRTLVRLKELRDSLDNSSFRGISLSNLPTWVWESLGDSIAELEEFLKEDEIPEIDLKLETVIVKGGEPIKMTVRNVFYVGLWGKAKTILYWFIDGKKTLTEYLDSPVTYERVLAEDIETYHSIDAEAELTKILHEECEKAIEKAKPKTNYEINEYLRGIRTCNRILDENVTDLVIVDDIIDGQVTSQFYYRGLHEGFVLPIMKSKGAELKRFGEIRRLIRSKIK